MRDKHPTAPQYKGDERKLFLDFLGSTSSSIEEDFHDVRIDPDGSVAWAKGLAPVSALAGSQGWIYLAAPPQQKIAADNVT